jgi:hypothetical protein
MTSADVDSICDGLVTSAKAELDSMDSKKSLAGYFIGTNSDIVASEGSIQQLLLTPGDTSPGGTPYTPQLLTIYRIRQDGYNAAGDPAAEATWVRVTQDVANQVSYGDVAVQYSTAGAVLSDTAKATAQQAEQDLKKAAPFIAAGSLLLVVALVAVAIIVIEVET